MEKLAMDVRNIRRILRQQGTIAITIVCLFLPLKSVDAIDLNGPVKNGERDSANSKEKRNPYRTPPSHYRIPPTSHVESTAEPMVIPADSLHLDSDSHRHKIDANNSHQEVDNNRSKFLQIKASARNLAVSNNNSATYRDQPYFTNLPRLAPSVVRRIEQVTSMGVARAERRAVFSARVEFEKALHLVTQALDAETHSLYFSQSLQRGLTALKEAKQFSPSVYKTAQQLQSIIDTHETPILKNSSNRDLSSLRALQAYHLFAEDHLAKALGKEPVAAKSLFCLGRIQSLLSTADDELAIPRSMTMYKAVLQVDPKNSLAANELGVLFAKFGQLNDAKNVLTHCISVNPRLSAGWRNLAEVHDRMGEVAFAKAARYELNRLPRHAQTPQDKLKVDWVDAKTFSKGSATSVTRTQRGPKAAPKSVPQTARHKSVYHRTQTESAESGKSLTSSVRHRVAGWFQKTQKEN